MMKLFDSNNNPTIFFTNGDLKSFTQSPYSSLLDAEEIVFKQGKVKQPVTAFDRLIFEFCDKQREHLFHIMKKDYPPESMIVFDKNMKSGTWNEQGFLKYFNDTITALNTPGIKCIVNARVLFNDFFSTIPYLIHTEEGWIPVNIALTTTLKNTNTIPIGGWVAALKSKNITINPTSYVYLSNNRFTPTDSMECEQLFNKTFKDMVSKIQCFIDTYQDCTSVDWLDSEWDFSDFKDTRIKQLIETTRDVLLCPGVSLTDRMLLRKHGLRIIEDVVNTTDNLPNDITRIRDQIVLWKKYEDNGRLIVQKTSDTVLNPLQSGDILVSLTNYFLHLPVWDNGAGNNLTICWGILKDEKYLYHTVETPDSELEILEKFIKFLNKMSEANPSFKLYSWGNIKAVLIEKTVHYNCFGDFDAHKNRFVDMQQIYTNNFMSSIASTNLYDIQSLVKESGLTDSENIILDYASFLQTGDKFFMDRIIQQNRLECSTIKKLWNLVMCGDFTDRYEII